MDTTDKSISKINEWAQTHLLRQGERWEQQSDRFENLKPRILPILADLGFVDGTSASFKNYQGAIVHGALLSRVRLRLNTLVEQWNQGVRFNHLYFLTGGRPLVESEKLALSEQAKTENAMVELVWRQSDIPSDMRQQVQVHFINASMKQEAIGHLIRPITNDTIKEWLKTNPPTGLYLAVTNAPYTVRQNYLIRSFAPDTYQFDTIGAAASEQERMSIYLDEVARVIFAHYKHP